MRLIDEQYTACPFYGSRRMTAVASITRYGELMSSAAHGSQIAGHVRISVNVR